MNTEFELVEPTPKLVLYDRMRLAVHECVRVDEAKKIKDQAEALAHYAKQRDDHELTKWMSEIRLRATAQIGKISRELEKATKVGGAGKVSLPTGGKTKEEQLAEAGISTSTANRYEQLAAPDEQLAPAVESALENYFAKAATEDKEPTFNGVQKAVKTALADAGVIPKDKKRKRKLKAPPRDLSWTDFSAGLDALGADREWNWDLICERLSVVSKELPKAKRAIAALTVFIEQLNRKYPQ
jgi:hypothetical protein